MKAYLERTPTEPEDYDCEYDSRRRFRLPDMDRSIPAAAWTVLRWCVASCRMRIDALHRPEEMVQNVGMLMSRVSYGETSMSDRGGWQVRGGGSSGSLSAYRKLSIASTKRCSSRRALITRGGPAYVRGST